MASTIENLQPSDYLVIWLMQYARGTRGPGKRGYVFKGSLEDCIAYIMSQPENDRRHTRKNLVIVDAYGKLAEFSRS